MWTKALWDEIPWDQINAGEREGWTFFDDFINLAETNEDTSATGKYAVMQDTGGTNTFGQTAGSEYGELAMVLSGTDNEENWIGTGGNTGGLANFILQATSVPHTIAFEARIKKSAIATGSVFVGFAEEGLVAADGLISDAEVIADVDYLGFMGEGFTTVDWAYNKASGTDVVTITDAHTFVADAYVKLGFKYDYKNSAARQIKCYVNGVLQSTFITKTNIDDATNFPGGEEMALLFGGKVGATAVAHTLTMDWWRAALLVNA
jgi:hypothetical protein